MSISARCLIPEMVDSELLQGRHQQGWKGDEENVIGNGEGRGWSKSFKSL